MAITVRSILLLIGGTVEQDDANQVDKEPGVRLRR
jgi:hypothetical protein